MFITSRFPSLGFDQFWISPPEYFEFTEWNRSFSAVGAFTTGELNLSASDRPRRVRTGNVDAALLKTLGVPAARGRHFTAQETRTGGPDVAMLSHETWQAVFAGRDMVGQTMSLNGRSWEVVGIMPPGFDVMDNKVEVWLPLRLDPSNRRNRGNHGLYLIGRLADGPDHVRSAGGDHHAVCAMGGTVPEDAQAQPELSPAPDGAGAGRDRRQRLARDLGPAGGGRLRAPHRLREPRQPAARARRDAAPRVCRARRAWRRPVAAAPPVHDRGHRAVAGRRRAGPGRGRRRPSTAPGGVPGKPAALGRGVAGPDGARLHAAGVAGDRDRLRPRPAAAPLARLARRHACAKAAAAAPPVRPATGCAAAW